jgi:hypothetical protein
MKISVNDQELFTLNETQKSVIKNNIHEDEFEADMRRRLQWVLMHKYEQCFKHLKSEWDAKLPALGVTSVPTDPDAYAQLVFAQPTYKSRKARELEASLEPK